MESVDATGNTGTVTFATEDRICTMDIGPRTTFIHFDDLDADVRDGFVLTQIGDGLDAEVTVVPA